MSVKYFSVIGSSAAAGIIDDKKLSVPRGKSWLIKTIKAVRNAGSYATGILLINGDEACRIPAQIDLVYPYIGCKRHPLNQNYDSGTQIILQIVNESAVLTTVGLTIEVEEHG